MTKIDYSGLPEHLREGFERYIERGIPMGGFGQAVLANDLFHAAAKADSVNLYYLREITAWVTNNAPAASYGSTEAIRAWVARRGLEGLGVAHA